MFGVLSTGNIDLATGMTRHHNTVQHAKQQRSQNKAIRQQHKFSPQRVGAV